MVLFIGIGQIIRATNRSSQCKTKDWQMALNLRRLMVRWSAKPVSVVRLPTQANRNGKGESWLWSCNNSVPYRDEILGFGTGRKWFNTQTWPRDVQRAKRHTWGKTAGLTNSCCGKVKQGNWIPNIPLRQPFQYGWMDWVKNSRIYGLARMSIYGLKWWTSSPIRKEIKETELRNGWTPSQGIISSQ